MNDCPHALDPLDIEALASGEPPLGRPEAAEHAAGCQSCSQEVARTARLSGLLEEAGLSGRVPADLADRVLRVRPFSPAERRSLAVWRAPLLLLATLAVSGTGLVTGLAGPRGSEGGIAAAAAFSLVGLGRACARWLADLAGSLPVGLEALSRLLAPTSAGWAALLLIVPTGYALRRVLSRAFARR